MYDRLGSAQFREHQFASEEETLAPGTAFNFVKGLLALNVGAGGRVVEVILVSRNDPDVGLRVTKSIAAHGLDITRIAYIGDDDIVPYLQAYKSDLFLTCNGDDAQAAVDAGLAAAALYRPPNGPRGEIAELRVAFDADAVVFSEESQKIYNSRGLQAFLEYEKDNANKMLAEGPLARFLMRLGAVQKARGQDCTPIRLAIVTARNTPAHERVIKTLRAWNVKIDEAFFLGGVEKAEILKAFKADIFFDDQQEHLAPAASDIACALVPYRSNSVLRRVAETTPRNAPSSELILVKPRKKTE